MKTQELMNLARSRLELFESGAIPLHQLVGDLKSVQESLSDPAPRWLGDFDRLRFTLEEVNALRLDASSTENSGHEELVRSTINDLKRLIDAV